MELENLIDTSFDEELLKLGVLKWLPWVGKNYSNNKRRLLIVGESHNIDIENEEEYDKEKKQAEGNENHTREVVNKLAIIRKEKKGRRYFDNTYRVLLNDNNFKALFWDQVCFYNFIQKPMDYRDKKNPQRPTNTEFYNSWNPFIDLIKILNPTDCIFTGVQASGSFTQAMNALSIKYSDLHWFDKIGRVPPRTASLNINENKIILSFIQHPSKYFSWEKWNSFLKNNNKVVMEALRNIVFPNETVV